MVYLVEDDDSELNMALLLRVMVVMIFADGFKMSVWTIDALHGRPMVVHTE
jgi:hypothetical protein